MHPPGLALRAPGLLRVLRERGPEHVPLDGTFAGCDRAGDSRPTSGRSTAAPG